jgi:hypothetical protein
MPNPVLDSYTQTTQVESLLILARTVKVYYNALVAMEFAPQQALALTIAYQNSLLLVGAQYNLMKGK